MKIPEPRKLQNGRWFIQLRINGISETATFDTKQEAEEWAIETKLHTKRKQRKQIDRDLTLRMCMEKYLAANRNILSPSTIAHNSRMPNYAFSSVIDTPIKFIRNWQEIVNTEASGLSAKTLSNRWSFARRSMEFCGIDVPDVRLPEIMPPDEHEWLSMEQIPVFLDVIRDTEYELPCLLGLNGLRLSEMLAVNKSSVDLKKGLIRVSGAVVWDGTEYSQKKSNKNKTSKRTVPILFPRLAELLAETEEPFCKLYPSSLSRIINRELPRHDLPPVGFHGLRHSCCAMLCNNGIQKKIVRKWLGWGSDRMIDRVYDHYENDMENDAVNIIRNLVSKI